MLRKLFEKKDKQKGVSKALKEQFKAEKEKQVESGEEEMVTVEFKAYTGCGCGGSYEYYFAEIPESEYENFDEFRRWDMDDLPDYVENIRRKY